jgi:hypothetical protein
MYERDKKIEENCEILVTEYMYMNFIPALTQAH